MPLSIRNEHAEQLAREIASLTGHNLTATIIEALEEKLERIKGSRKSDTDLADVLAISRRCSALPDLDLRSPDEILGYDGHGVNPHGD
ncbi:MAG TPA: type II toxin-antitoxin system VapB family antitoxin [Alphaproteobacteria bacterium]|nr:type II toxin-antitoxin system VapB family antitoxin [Alphaproteobacteria bacterium]